MPTFRYTYAFLAILTLVLISNCQSNDPEVEEPNNPNIVLLIGDDHSTRVFGAYGNKIVRTPNLDRLAAGGLRLTNAFANAPMCSASRQSFITGRYPHATGVTLLRTSFPEEQVTIAEHLRNLGYETGVFGKTHFNNNKDHGYNEVVTRRDHRTYLDSVGPFEVPEGLKVRPQWKPFRDPARVWLNADGASSGIPKEHDIATFYADQAIAFMEKHQDQPFFLSIGFHEPHSPFNFPMEYYGKYQPEDMPMPPVSPEDDQWIPAVFKDLTEEERKGIVAAYYTSVEYLDNCIGKVVEAIERLKLEENTIIVYLGDHGYLLNDHKRFEKHMMWEPAVNAPLIVKVPGAKGLVSNALVEFVDLTPTLLELAEKPELSTVQGKSFAHLFQNPDTTHKTRVYSEFLADNKAMVRDGHYKYIFTSGKTDLQQGYATGNPPPGITHRLYDVQQDPYEQRNLSTDTVHAETLLKLQDHLLQWFLNTHPKVDEKPVDASLEELLVFFCEPPDEGANIGAQ